MKRIAVIARSSLSLLGLVLIVLGILFWTGHALSMVSLHMLLGVLFVVCLWILVATAFYAREGRGLALLVLVWSLIVPVLGVAQLRILPGSAHWVIQAIHLLVGLIAIGLGHALTRPILRRGSETPAAPKSG